MFSLVNERIRAGAARRACFCKCAVSRDHRRLGDKRTGAAACENAGRGRRLSRLTRRLDRRCIIHAVNALWGS